jgi:catechol 2,3-dioxygenase-like lactoylglutathione lyase family enzyme
MLQRLAEITLVVRDYDEAIAYYTRTLGFDLLEDTALGGGKRWVRVGPPGGRGTALLLARAVTDAERSVVGAQTGGRVAFFLETTDFVRDHEALTARGVRFVRPRRDEPYGIVAVFEDLYGNLFDLVERAPSRRTRLERNRRAALVFAIVAMLLQAGRVLLWGYWPPLRQIPIDADGYLAGGVGLFAVYLVGRRGAAWAPMLAATWGIWCGILYRTFTSQLADANRHAGHEACVLAVKGALLVVAVAGLVDSVRGLARDRE